MNSHRIRICSPVVVSALYFAGAAFSVHYSRFGHGVAMIWVSSAIMAAWLSVIRWRQWPAVLAGCGIGSFAATAWLGLGLASALPLALVNLAEGAAAALVVRALIRHCWPDETLELVAGYYFGLGLVIPACSAVLGAGAAALTAGVPFETNFYHWMIGHSVGLLTVLPFGAAVARSCQTREPLLGGGQGTTALLLCATMATVTLAVFTQTIRPFMLVPLLFTLFAAVWSNKAVAMALPVILAIVGGPLVLHGHGPLESLAVDPGDKLQLFQLYVAIAVLCALPVTVEQERRRREMNRLARQEARWRKISGDAGHLLAELAQAAATDPLTGLPNRRVFEQAVADCLASGAKACLVMLDIDHFKRINDRHGHQVGDEVLRAFGEVAGRCLRSTDLMARLGGEEFALLLRDTTPEQAEMVCGRLGRHIAEAAIVTRAGALSITVSCGIARLQGNGEAALAAADGALYTAKAAGRARHAVAA